MSTTAELLDGLRQALASQYPTSRAPSATRGRVGCAVIVQRGQYDAAVCEPVAVTVTAEIRIYASGSSEQAIIDLPHHLDLIGGLIRGAGWMCEDWRASAMDETKPPYIAITATAIGTG